MQTLHDKKQRAGLSILFRVPGGTASDKRKGIPVKEFESVVDAGEVFAGGVLVGFLCAVVCFVLAGGTFP